MTPKQLKAMREKIGASQMDMPALIKSMLCVKPKGMPLTQEAVSLWESGKRPCNPFYAHFLKLLVDNHNNVIHDKGRKGE